MKRNFRKKAEKQKGRASDHINSLFKQADANPAMSSRYTALARKIAMKFRIKLASAFKRKFCRHCYTYFIPPKNCRVRIHSSRIIYLCHNCKKFTRIPLKPGKKTKKK